MTSLDLARYAFLTAVVIVVSSCAARQVHVSDSIGQHADADRLEQGGHCKLLEVMPVGPQRVQMLCAGDVSWLARGRGSRLKLSKVHPYIRGHAYSHAFQRGGKIESVRGFAQKIRHIVIDGEGKVAIQDWPGAGGSLVAATAGPGGSVTVLLRHGNDYYINDIKKTDKAAGSLVPWAFAEAGLIDSAAGFIPQDGVQAPTLWLGGRKGIVIGSPEAVTDRIPLEWSPSTALLAVTPARGRVAFVVRDDSGVQVIHKAAPGEWVAVHVSDTASMAESTCAANLSAYFTAPGRESCTRRGHRVEVAAMVSHGSALWLVLGTHRYERRIHQRIEGGGIASALRSDMLASRDRVELALVKIVAGSRSAPSWRITDAQSDDLRCDAPKSACHALDDLAAVRLAVAHDVVHVAAQSSERMLHFAVELRRRRAGDRAVVLARTVLRETVKKPEVEVARAPTSELQAKPPHVPTCAVAQTRCAERLCADLRSDASHCGACGHRCVSGRCNRGKCAPVCYRDSDCNPRAKRQGTGYTVGFSLVCLYPGRSSGGAGPGRGCRHSGCYGDTTCSTVTGQCISRSCRRRSDCKVPGSTCAAPDGQRGRRCLPPGHCGPMPIVPHSRGR